MEKEKSIETSISFLTLDKDGIGYMHFKDRMTMGIPEQIEHFNAIVKLTNNKRTPFVVTAGDFVTFKHEAKVNAKKMESLRPVCASALVVNNFAYKLIADFFLKFQKPGIPYKTFSNKEDAVEWCRKFVTKADSKENEKKKNIHKP